MKATVSVAASVINDEAYPRLRDVVVETTGLSYYLHQQQELAARIRGRMEAIGLDRVKEYLGWLSDVRTGEGEWDALVAELTIGETYFFRHQEQFDALRDQALPDIIERNQKHRRLRIWSAGCATGAELYSIAIVLRRDLAHLLAGWDITLLGTDVNREFLACGQRGEFNDWALRSMSPAIKRECFSQAGDAWSIKPEYRQDVSFQYHNLVQHPFPSLLNNLSAFDLIVCRNVMIYFDHDIVERLVGQFHDCLSEGGWLVVGHAEPNVDLFRNFRTVNAPGAVLYQNCLADAGSNSPAQPSRAADHAGARKLTVPGNLSPPVVGPSKRPSVPRDLAPVRAHVPMIGAPLEVAQQLANIRAMADRAAWDDALRSCQELITAAGLNPTAHLYHALSLEQTGDHAGAEQALRRAIYLDRDFVLAHYHLGLLRQKRGDKNAAQRAFRSALQLLDRMNESQPLEDCDGLTVGALKQWTQTHLDVLSRK